MLPLPDEMKMTLYSVLFLASVLGTPISNFVAWWVWLRRDRVHDKWRSVLLFIGLLSVSALTVIYYIWIPVANHILMKETPLWKLKDVSGEVAIPLILLALVGAIFGKGTSRIPIAICAVLGFVLGIPVGVL